MRKFLRKSLLFFLPLIAIGSFCVGTFYYFDPFRILKRYDIYYNSIVEYNEDFVATERYLKNTEKYDSFIFGSSRAGCGFNTDNWSTYVNSQGSSFNFAASCETIFGIHGKIRLIDEEEGKLKNVLLVIDTDATFAELENSKTHIFIKHYIKSQKRVKGNI